jgi:hypothetical protein
MNRLLLVFQSNDQVLLSFLSPEELLVRPFRCIHAHRRPVIVVLCYCLLEIFWSARFVLSCTALLPGREDRIASQALPGRQAHRTQEQGYRAADADKCPQRRGTCDGWTTSKTINVVATNGRTTVMVARARVHFSRCAAKPWASDCATSATMPPARPTRMTAGRSWSRFSTLSWVANARSNPRTPGLPPGGFLASVWCDSATACIATGSTKAGTLAERLSGTTWNVLPTPNPPGTQGDFIGSLSCTSLSACTGAGGAFAGPAGSPPQTLAERWNGLRWRIQPTPLLPGIGDLSNFSVACPAQSTCIAAGGFENDGPGAKTLTERWRATGTSAAPGAPVVSPRTYHGILGCIRAAMGEGFAAGAATGIALKAERFRSRWCLS